jgi:DtxR family Mn-dependent transcriptional regulator
MSEDVERRLLEILDHPAVSPYGNPIPGLGELGDNRPVTGFMDGVSRLTSVMEGAGPGHFRVVRLGENLQTRIDLMKELDAAAVRPGATVEARRLGDEIAIAGAGVADPPATPARLAAEVAKHIFVEN